MAHICPFLFNLENQTYFNYNDLCQALFSFRCRIPTVCLYCRVSLTELLVSYIPYRPNGKKRPQISWDEPTHKQTC